MLNDARSQITSWTLTSVYHYGSDEYVTIVSGLSPDGKYAITAHGEGDNGYDHFHIYLTDAVSGKKIGPLEEIVDALDTGADAFCAKWSNDSKTVTIIYRVDQLNRYLPLRAVSYRISERAAHRQRDLSRCADRSFSPITRILNTRRSQVRRFSARRSNDPSA